MIVVAILGILAAVAILKRNAKAAFKTDSAYPSVTAALCPDCYVLHRERR